MSQPSRRQLRPIQRERGKNEWRSSSSVLSPSLKAKGFIYKPNPLLAFHFRADEPTISVDHVGTGGRIATVDFARHAIMLIERLSGLDWAFDDYIECVNRNAGEARRILRECAADFECEFDEEAKPGAEI